MSPQRAELIAVPFGAIIIALFLAACNLPQGSTEPTPTASPTVAPSPTPTPEPAGMAVVGPVETVFDYTTDRCEREDIPDLPARAFRDADGIVHLMSSHLLTRRNLGPDLNEVEHNCDVVMTSDHQSDPALHNDNEWLAATYTEDGTTVYALVHQEYHGWEHSSDCPPPDHFPCWFNSVTMAVSTDGGNSYSDLLPPPDHMVATLPDRYRAGAGPSGVFEPGNLIKKDGYYYSFIRIDEFDSIEQRICLMRTDDLSAPDAWRAWGGENFDMVFEDPYQLPDEQLGGVPCARIDVDSLGVMEQSITYNTYLEKYVMVGATAIHLDGQEVWGILYATSDDLIEWDDRQLLTEVELSWTYQPGDDVYLLYPSLLDPESDSRNFETSDKTAYVYFTRFNQPGGDPLDRDLVRVPVEFFETVEEAEAAAVPFVIQP